MADAGDIDRILATTRCVVLGTVDAEGRPWVTPVFFAPLGSDRMYWVSSPDSRHSRNIAARPAVALTVFDSTVAVGRAEAAYFDATAERAHPEEREAALAALDERLPAGRARPSTTSTRSARWCSTAPTSSTVTSSCAAATPNTGTPST